MFRFENGGVLAEFDRTIAALDTRPGPHSGASALFLPAPPNPTGGFDLDQAVIMSAQAASVWTETKKDVFVIRADFPDRPTSADPVVAQALLANVLNTTVSQAIRDFSYDKTWIDGAVSAGIIRLPRTAASYAADLGGGNSDNGALLAYAWDFGSGFTFDNHPTASTVWNSGGTFTVRLTVSDMKGGSVTATKVVTVADPLTTWANRANTSVGDFRALAASPTHVLAVGEDFTTFAGPAALSTDGIAWGNGTLGSNRQGYGAVWDGAQFIVCGMEYDFAVPGWVGLVLTSPTGTGWTHRLFTGTSLRGIAARAGVRVAVGENGHIRRSLDGVTWTAITSGTTRHLEGVAYGAGRFVATGYAPAGSGDVVVLTSPDGVYFAAGRDRDNDNVHMDPVSIDGANWVQDFGNVAEERHAAIFFQNTFITVGNFHSIRQGGVITPGDDGDFDTLANLFEYGTGLDPLSAAASNGAAAPRLVRETTNPNLADRYLPHQRATLPAADADPASSGMNERGMHPKASTGLRPPSASCGLRR